MLLFLWNFSEISGCFNCELMRNVKRLRTNNRHFRRSTSFTVVSWWGEVIRAVPYESILTYIIVVRNHWGIMVSKKYGGPPLNLFVRELFPNKATTNIHMIAFQERSYWFPYMDVQIKKVLKTSKVHFYPLGYWTHAVTFSHRRPTATHIILLRVNGSRLQLLLECKEQVRS